MDDPSRRPLGVQAGVALSPEQTQWLSALESYDLWFVEERLARKGPLSPERIAPAVSEFKRYMALVGLGHRGLGMASPEVDEVWHAFLVFTREYAAFCREIFGEFIHHVPQTSRTPDPKPRSVSFHIAYREVFGPPGPLWPRDHPGGTDCGEGDCTGEARVATTGTRIGVGDCGEGDCTGDSAPVLQALWTAADCGTEECTSEG